MTKVIHNFPNYSISIEGVVKNRTTDTVKARWLGANGYLHVDLYHNKKATKIAIHRLLALHFISNHENKRTVNHIDGNKLNNSLDNLEWATDAENMQHAYDTGLNHQPKKISDALIDEVLIEFYKGKNLTSIVASYEFSLPTFSTYVEAYTLANGTNLIFEAEKERQKQIRSNINGLNRRNLIDLHMIDKETGETLETFTSLAEAKHFLGKKSSGPISNTLAGRQKSGYGYFWKKLILNDHSERK